MTITTAAANGVAVNDIVEISGVAVAGYNGRFTVTSVLSPTKFTFDNSSTGLAASSGGTAVHALGFGAGGGSVFDDGNAGGTGGGISQYEFPQPSYQQGTVTKVTQSTTYRTIPDVSFVGGTATPVYEYDSAFGAVAPEPTGGTSLSSPCWAGLVAIVDQGLALGGLPPLNTDTSAGATLQTALYDSPLTDFHDITSGYNGFNAGPGYDLSPGLARPSQTCSFPTWRGPASTTRSRPRAVRTSSCWKRSAPKWNCSTTVFWSPGAGDHLSGVNIIDPNARMTL